MIGYGSDGTTGLLQAEKGLWHPHHQEQIDHGATATCTVAGPATPVMVRPRGSAPLRTQGFEITLCDVQVFRSAPLG